MLPLGEKIKVVSWLERCVKQGNVFQNCQFFSSPMATILSYKTI